jgi:hypothetical protein
MTARNALVIRRYVRRAAGLGSHDTCPVEYTDSDDAPHVEGQSYHYVTPGGAPVRYPNAYRRAWGKPVYVPSSRRVLVGLGWLLRQVEAPAANDTAETDLDALLAMGGAS